MSGWTDAPLSARGRAQIVRLAHRLLLEQVEFDAIYSSPLRRAAHTAAAIAASSKRPILELDSLKEISCGEVDGRPITEVEASRPELWRANLRQDDENFRWPGGESYREFRDRCVEAIDDIAARHDGGRIAVVTHAGVISQIAGRLHGLGPAQWEPFRPGPASMSELLWTHGSGAIVTFDDQAHLRD